VLTVLRYNSMFALVALGMCFVIMSGGIDLSVGTTAALGSVVSALLSAGERGLLLRRDLPPYPGVAPTHFAYSSRTTTIGSWKLSTLPD
jgi:ribose/xylose/arabinose/galactoside ABC-type transport system permease subunit